MKKVVTLMVALVLAGIAWADEQVSGSLVERFNYDRDLCNTGTFVIALPSTSVVWVDGASRGKFKADERCRIRISLTRLAGPGLASDGAPGTGDEVVCLVNFLSGGECQTVALRGEVTGGGSAKSVRITADVLQETGMCFGGAMANVECYEPDPVYSATDDCNLSTETGFPIPFASNSGQLLCRNAIGSYMNGPTATRGLIAVMGMN